MINIFICNLDNHNKIAISYYLQYEGGVMIIIKNTILYFYQILIHSKVFKILIFKVGYLINFFLINLTMFELINF